MSPSRFLSELLCARLDFNKLRFGSVALNATKSGRGERKLMDNNCARKMSTKCITIDDMNPNIKVLEYAVRGPLVIRSTEIEKELKKVCFLIFINLT